MGEAEDMYIEEVLPAGALGKPPGALAGRFKMRTLTEPIGLSPAVSAAGWERAGNSRVRLMGAPLGSALMNGPAEVPVPKYANKKQVVQNTEDDEDDDDGTVYKPLFKRRGTGRFHEFDTGKRSSLEQINPSRRHSARFFQPG